MNTKIDVVAIVDEAEKAAKDAEKEYVEKYLNGQDQLLCGFAYVVVKPARGKLVNELKKRDVGYVASWGGGGYHVWNPSHSSFQNVDCKYAAACAYAEVLQKYGFNAEPHSRLD